MRKNATSLPFAGVENDEKDDNVNKASHTINLSLISDFGINQEDVKLEKQSKIKPRPAILEIRILLDSCFRRLRCL